MHWNVNIDSKEIILETIIKQQAIRPSSTELELKQIQSNQSKNGRLNRPNTNNRPNSNWVQLKGLRLWKQQTLIAIITQNCLFLYGV